MKKISRIIVLVALLFMFSCKKEPAKVEEVIPAAATTLQENANVPKTQVKFDKELHDFGQINQGDVKQTVFQITNIGENDLYIVDAHGSCGCTVPEVTKEAIKPGESAPINVKFDSKGKSGEVTKTVMITCNTEKSIENVKIKASIITKNSTNLADKSIINTKK